MKRKCTVCGGTNLAKYDCYAEQYLQINVDAYVCLDCGHIEMYACEQSHAYKETVAKVKNEKYVKKEIDTREKLLEEANKNLVSLEKKVNQCTEEVSKLEEAANDENITVKEQKNLLAKVEETKNKLNIAKVELARGQSKVRQLEYEINRFKEKGRL